MKHDMTQPVIDLNQQCRRCGSRFSALQVIATDLKPNELDCPGLSLKHWSWRKLQNIKHILYLGFGAFWVPFKNKISVMDYVRWCFTTEWAWH